jgi:hypothetical protein
MQSKWLKTSLKPRHLTSEMDNPNSTTFQTLPRLKARIDLHRFRYKKVSNDEEALSFQKNLWQQIFGLVRAQCEKCGKARWVDGRKIPPKKVLIRYSSCAHSFVLKPVSNQF